MRRANGSGSISKLGGNRRKKYAVKVSYRDDDGLIRQKLMGTFERKADAQAWLDAYNTDRLRGTIAPEPGAVTVTIGELWECWSARELPKLSAKGQANYTGPWRRRLCKYESKPIRSMRADDWQAIIDADVAAGSSSGTVGKLKVLMGALSKYAMERDYIAKDYTAFVTLPAHKAVHEKGRLSDAQVAQVAEMAAHGDPSAVLALILCYTGMRIDELLQIECSSYHPEHGGYLQGGLKTDAGKDRIVPVHPRIAPYIQQRLDAGGKYLFPGVRDTSKPMDYKTALRRVSKVTKAVDLPQATPHWCRYTFASMAEEAGVDELAKKWIMGHSTEHDITHHYTKLSIEYICREMLKIP